MAGGKIQFWWGVTAPSGTEVVDFEDLNIKDKAEWDALSSEEQKEKLQDYLDNLPERTSLVVDEFQVQ